MKKLKTNNVRRPGKAARFTVLAAVGAVVIGAAAFGYSKLKAVYLSQCVITDVASQVSVTTGRMVRKEVVTELFGLRRGVNLADIDFAARCEEAKSRLPVIRDISVALELPNRVYVNVVEREPAVRVGIAGQRADLGRVADWDGVVFSCRRGTGSLPVIRERMPPGTGVGKRLSGRSLAALRLLEACSRKELQELGVLDVDTSKPDFLVLTLGGYSRARVSWEGMDAPDGPEGLDVLAKTLRHLAQAVRQKKGEGAVIWTATDPKNVYADTRGLAL